MLLITCSMLQKAVFILNNFVQAVTLLKCIQDVIVLSLNWKWGFVWSNRVPHHDFCDSNSCYNTAAPFHTHPIHYSLIIIPFEAIQPALLLQPSNSSFNDQCTIQYYTVWATDSILNKPLKNLSPGHTSQLTYLNNLWTLNTSTIQT
jgi:hypothetical protein